MSTLTDANVRLLVGLFASLTMLALIVLDAFLVTYTLESGTIYLLTGLIWSFLGIDVMNRAAQSGERRGNGRRRRWDEPPPPRRRRNGNDRRGEWHDRRETTDGDAYESDDRQGGSADE